MSGADEPSRAPRTLYAFKAPEDLQMFATGCDSDIGGNSSVHLDLVESAKDKSPYARFWGDMRLDVKSQIQGRFRGGYAAMRNRPRPTLFGEMLENIEFHKYLALRVRLGGDSSTHNAYYVNLQTNGPISTDIWQHRLFFKRKNYEWEDIFIPFKNFVRTNNGELSEVQLEMSPKIRTIGIAILGGNSGSAGKYDLGIDSIRIVNEEDTVSDLESNKKQSKSTSDAKNQSWENLKL